MNGTPTLFGRRHLRELLEERPGPAVTIFLPPGGPAPDSARERLRLRAAVDRAGKLLTTSASPDSAAELLVSLSSLLDGARAWPVGEVMAFFCAPGFVRVHRLSGDIDQIVVVGPTFHTRPLIRYLQSPSRFWVLELGQGAVRLWEGDARGVRPVDPNPLPPDLETALGYEFERDSAMVHRAAGRDRTAARRSQQGGSVGAFSGHGVGDDDRDVTLDRLFGTVDEALRDYLGPEPDPVIIAAVSEHHSRYRSSSSIDSLTSSGIEASISTWSPRRIHEAAWPIALATADAHVASTLELWERAYASGKAEPDLASVARLAVAGRIRALLIERDRRLWGTIDRHTGEIAVAQVGGDDPGADAVELLDEVSELVVLRAGSTLVVPSERMPTETGVAAILR